MRCMNVEAHGFEGSQNDLLRIIRIDILLICLLMYYIHIIYPYPVPWLGSSLYKS